MARRRRRRRRGLRGLGILKVGMGKDLIPPAVGLGLTAGTTLGVRMFLTPTPGSPAEAMYRAAPWIGVAAGVLGGLAVGVLGSRGQAAAVVMTSVVTGAVLFGMERLHASKPGAISALLGTGAVAAGAPAAGVTGLRAIVPQYPDKAFATRGLGAIVMDRLKGNEQGQGADVQLRGLVNAGAFGHKTAA